MLCILVVFWSKLIEDDLIGINDIKEKWYDNWVSMGVKIKFLLVCVCWYMNVFFFEEYKVVKCIYVNFFIFF